MTDTERIDLDELAESDATDDEPAARRGDWFWKGEGDPNEEPDEPEYSPAESGVSRRLDAGEEVPTPAAATEDDHSGAADAPDGESSDGESSADESSDRESPADESPGDETSADESDDGPVIPKVPRENADKPVGVSSSAGGAGAGAGPSKTARAAAERTGSAGEGSGSGTSEAAAEADAKTEAEADAKSEAEADAGEDAGGAGDGPNHEAGTNEARKAVAAGEAEAKGPHGGGVDDMTMAISFSAMAELSDPQLTVAKAREWADWIGIVGEVAAPVINKFQREHTVDADFFNGTGTGPAERLANIGETSMFYAERMVLVGTPDDEWIAEEAGWEFIPFETAAEKAGWDHEE